MLNRRLFMGFLLSAPAMLITFKSLISKNFKTTYIVDYSPTNLDLSKVGTKRNPSFRDYLLPELDNQWYKNYESCRQKYIRAGYLLESNKSISTENKKIVFTNTWRSEEDFLAFHYQTNMNYLQNQFNRSSFNTQLLIG